VASDPAGRRPGLTPEPGGASPSIPSASRRSLPTARSRLLGGVVIFLAAVAVFLPSLGNGLVLDDAALLEPLSHPDDLRWRDLFTQGLFSDVRPYGGYYRPLTSLSFAAETALGGAAPARRHLTNLLLHAGVSVGAFLLLCRLLVGTGGLAFAAGLLFALHPVHVDAVDPITGRGDLLAAGLLLAAWSVFHRGRTAVEGGRWRLLGPWVAAGLYAAALLAKESAIVLPALVLVGAWGTGGARRFRDLLRRPGDFAPLLGVLLLYLGARTLVLGALIEPGLPDPLDNPLAEAGGLAGWVGVPAVWLRAARVLVWPWPLAPDYSTDSLLLPVSVTDLRVAAGWALALGAALAWAWTARRMWRDPARRRRGASFLGLSILLIPFLPAANLLFVAPVLFAERLLYLPVLGFTLLLAAAGARLLEAVTQERMRRTLSGAVLVAVAAACAGLTLAHHAAYADDLAVWSQATKVVPGNAKAWYNLGNAWMRRSRFRAAAEAYLQSVERRPELAIGWSNLGVARAREGDGPGATEAFERALSLDAGLVQAHAGLSSQALRRGDIEAARRHLTSALLLDPEGPDAATIRALLSRIEGLKGDVGDRGEN